MPTSKDLLDKVYTHLDTLDVTAMSMSELKDFLEVVQKGQFLESFNQASAFPYGGMGCMPFNGFSQPVMGPGDGGVCSGDGEPTTVE